MRFSPHCAWKDVNGNRARGSNSFKKKRLTASFPSECSIASAETEGGFGGTPDMSFRTASGGGKKLHFLFDWIFDQSVIALARTVGLLRRYERPRAEAPCPNHKPHCRDTPLMAVPHGRWELWFYNLPAKTFVLKVIQRRLWWTWAAAIHPLMRAIGC